VTIAIPTLAAGARLAKCLEALAAQTMQGFRVVVVDNSGQGLAGETARRFDFAEVIENRRNAGYGAAVNQAWRHRPAEFLMALNDDTVPRPGCLEALVAALEGDRGAGMAAPRILLSGTETLDSAGMLLARDGSSIQRGHAQPASAWERPQEALFPSGCAAIYRGAMLAETGLFDEALFLYHEDTDLGLRGCWLGWHCLYVPRAEVEHWYSASAGRASAAKAWYVERNRLRVVVKLFPFTRMVAAPVYAAARYALHLRAALAGRGKAAEFGAAGLPLWKLPWYVAKAHLHLIAALPELLRQRRQTPRRILALQFIGILDNYRVGIREVAIH
jgi:GT2 family glycosyltransferase